MAQKPHKRARQDSISSPDPAVSSEASHTTESLSDNSDSFLDFISTAPVDSKTTGLFTPNTLRIDRLPNDYTEEKLKTLFGQFGAVIQILIMDEQPGSKKFAFLTFADKSDAERATISLNFKFLRRMPMD